MRKDLFADIPKRVRVVEVGPRDGLQNEAAIVSTQDKVRFIEMLAEAGLAEIEATSFVSPKRVPQLADAEELMRRLPSQPGVRYSALVPNEKGLARALSAGVRAIAFFTAASETFNQKNIGMSIDESLAGFRAMMPAAREHGLWVRAYISTAFVCPYEGEIAPSQAVAVARELTEMGADEISIGDTIGRATPVMVARLTEALQDGSVPLAKTAYHFHDTGGLALTNVLTALQYGVAAFDSAAGGIGGCPFAPGAPGNLATEDLLALLDGMGVATGVDTERVREAAGFIRTRLSEKIDAETC